MLYFALKYLHIMGAAVLIGTGSGIAFFMLAAHLQRNPIVIAGVARIVVIADFIFTATAVIVQPITGVFLALHAGYPLSEGWIVWSHRPLYFHRSALASRCLDANAPARPGICSRKQKHLAA